MYWPANSTFLIHESWYSRVPRSAEPPPPPPPVSVSSSSSSPLHAARNVVPPRRTPPPRPMAPRRRKVLLSNLMVTPSLPGRVLSIRLGGDHHPEVSALFVSGERWV